MSDTHLYYIYDPMCSWCYAFSPSWNAVKKILPTNIHINYLLGGLAPDSIEPMPEGMRHAIQKTWRRIEIQVPGTQFNYDFWSLNTPFRSTYPACRSILAAGKQGYNFEAEMLQAIQIAYYLEAKNPSLQPVLQECATKIGLDIPEFTKDVASSEIEQALLHDIQLAYKLEISSFPSLCLLHNGKNFSIAVNYLDHQMMIDEIANVL